MPVTTAPKVANGQVIVSSCNILKVAKNLSAPNKYGNTVSCFREEIVCSCSLKCCICEEAIPGQCVFW